ncbi:hypothetical protein [Epilithonimonas zeae]|uniref:hypothetical protein n=1 Tax=Epilithonimonas zeae TaxID=1416779 RepID=UPI00200BD759|nr:hypothetical protein [Epilithonimonas zeae]UQB67861.1 hypothetical protein KI430_12570 [Epilithonimonas zeae]
MKNIFTLFFISLILFSCSRDNEDEIIENNEPLITKMNLILYPNSFPYGNSELSFNFQYDNDKRLIKKTGGFLSVSGSTGFSGYFTDKIFTTLIYNSNNVTIENFSSSPDFTVPKNSKYFILNNNQQIKQKDVPSTFYSNYRDEKQFFTYNTSGQLTEIKTTLPNMPYYPPDDYIETYLEKFYYDSKGNLTKSEYFEQRDGVNKGIKIIRTFGDYDNSLNPFKRFYLLDEYFYRAISKNNYRKYTEIKYNEIGNITSSIEQTWTFNYDSSGNIIIN